MATLDDLSTYLVAEGIGTEGTDLFTTIMPASPDACVALFETGGTSPEGALGSTTVRIERPGVMLQARGAPDDYDTPRAKAQDVWNALNAIDAQSLSGTFYERCQPLQSPFHFTTDKNDRILFSSNYLIDKEPAGSAMITGQGKHFARLYNTTTDATPTELFRDGSAQRLLVGTGVSIAFDIRVIATQSDGSSVAHFTAAGTIKNIGGTTALVGSVRVGQVANTPGWTIPAVTADDTNDALVITVTGAAATTIEWESSVDMVVSTI